MDYVKELKKTGVTRHILWEEYIRKYPDGYSYSQFCYHFQIWRSASGVFFLARRPVVQFRYQAFVFRIAIRPTVSL